MRCGVRCRGDGLIGRRQVTFIVGHVGGRYGSAGSGRRGRGRHGRPEQVDQVEPLPQGAPRPALVILSIVDGLAGQQGVLNVLSVTIAGDGIPPLAGLALPAGRAFLLLAGWLLIVNSGQVVLHVLQRATELRHAVETRAGHVQPDHLGREDLRCRRLGLLLR